MTPSTHPLNSGNNAPARTAGTSLFITFLTGGLIGAALFWIASDLSNMPGQSAIPAGMKMENHANMNGGMSEQEAGAHSHGMLAVDEWSAKPAMTATIQKDPVGGWNLNLRTENFTYNAAAAGLENNQGEGHAHIYVNGAKLARIYGDWFHIGTLPSGHNMISVTLNANDHSLLTQDGVILEQKLIVIVE